MCTYTNVAVDNLVEGLAAAGVKPLRVAYGGKVKADLAERTLDFKMSIHPLNSSLDAVTKEADASSTRLLKLKDKKATLSINSEKRLTFEMIALERQQGTLKRKIYRMKQVILRDILSKADVVRALLLDHI